MIVTLSSELSVLFSTVLYGAFKFNISVLIKEIQYMTDQEFDRKFADQNYLTRVRHNKTIKIYSKKSPSIIHLTRIEIE